MPEGKKHMSSPKASAIPAKRNENTAPGDIERRAALHALRMGTRFIKTRTWETAGIWLRQAVQIRPDFFEAYFLLGDVYLELGSMNEAVESYERAIGGPDFNQGGAHVARRLRPGPSERPASRLRNLVRVRAPEHAIPLLFRKGCPDVFRGREPEEF